jgi:hypothetical protein
MSHVSIIRPRHLVWLPAVLLVSAGILSAFGVSLTPSGRAATATGTTTISATVLPEISLDLDLIRVRHVEPTRHAER